MREVEFHCEYVLEYFGNVSNLVKTLLDDNSSILP